MVESLHPRWGIGRTELDVQEVLQSVSTYPKGYLAFWDRCPPGPDRWQPLDPWMPELAVFDGSWGCPGGCHALVRQMSDAGGCSSRIRKLLTFPPGVCDTFERLWTSGVRPTLHAWGASPRGPPSSP